MLAMQSDELNKNLQEVKSRAKELESARTEAQKKIEKMEESSKSIMTEMQRVAQVRSRFKNERVRGERKKKRNVIQTM